MNYLCYNISDINAIQYQKMSWQTILPSINYMNIQNYLLESECGQSDSQNEFINTYQDSLKNIEIINHFFFG